MRGNKINIKLILDINFILGNGKSMVVRLEKAVTEQRMTQA